MTIESFGGGTMRRLLLSALLVLAFTISTSYAKKFTFKLPHEDDPKILLEADFEISIKAMERNMVVAAWVGGSHDHPDIEIYGLSDKRSIMELRFPTEGITWGLIFNEKSVNDVSLDRFVRFTPEVIFPPFDTLTFPITYQDKGNTEYHSVMKSYECDHTTQRTYAPTSPLKGKVTFLVSVTVSNFRVQAYHVKDGQFSPSIHCNADHVTTPTTPSHVIPRSTDPAVIPVPGGVPKHTFIGNDTINNSSVVCISMEGQIGFEIAYYVFDGRYRTDRKLVKVLIPEKATSEANCSPDTGTQQLSVTFLNNWTVDFTFSINVAYTSEFEQGDYQSRMDYSIDSVSLKYNIDDDQRFPKAFRSEGSNFSISFTEHENLPRKKANSGYFICNTPKKFKMSEDVTLVLSNFMFKAFIDDGDTNFYGMPDNCEEDMKKIGASTLVVVVGCLVITFSLIIFIALLALISTKCRTKRKRRKYTEF